MSLDEVRHKGYGLVEKRPNSINFEDFTVSILGDAKGQVLEFVQRWMALITNFDEDSEVSADGVPAEMFNYPEEYWGTVELYLYDITAQIYKTYTLKKAFPVNIGAVELGWAQNDTIMRVPVSFSYRSYKISPTQTTNSTETPINSFTDSTTRSFRSLQNLTPNSNLDEYTQRFNLA